MNGGGPGGLCELGRTRVSHSKHRVMSSITTAVQQKLEDYASIYQVREIAFDRWASDETIAGLN